MMGFERVTDNRYHLKSQSWVATGDFKHKKTGKIVRVRVERNAYDDQSGKTASIFNLDRGAWNPLHSEPLVKTDRCYKISYTSQELKPHERDAFDYDIAMLLAVPGQILDAA